MFPSDIPHGHSNSSYRAVTVTIPWRKHKRLSGKQQRENHFVKHHQLSMPHRQYSMKKKGVDECQNGNVFSWCHNHRDIREKGEGHTATLPSTRQDCRELPMCQCEHLICPFNFYCELTDEKIAWFSGYSQETGNSILYKLDMSTQWQRTKLIWPAWDCWQPGILSLEVPSYSEDGSRDLESALSCWQARAGELANKLILRSLALVRQ